MAKFTKVSELTPGQNGSLKRHAPHHTSAHIKVMVREMKKGDKFGVAHEKAIKEKGV